jgi:hypothetical protein
MRAAILTAFIVLAGVAQADTLTAFHTPSGNIHCKALVGEGGAIADCEILDVTGPPPLPRPFGCEAEWGRRVMVTEVTPGEMVCEAGTLRDPHGLVLNYGSSVGIGDITCRSSQQGLECVNRQGPGFFLSRASRRVF